MYVLLQLLCWAHTLSASPSFMTSFPPLHFDFRSQLAAETKRQRGKEKGEKKRKGEKRKVMFFLNQFHFHAITWHYQLDFFKKSISVLLCRGKDFTIDSQNLYFFSSSFSYFGTLICFSFNVLFLWYWLWGVQEPCNVGGIFVDQLMLGLVK